MSQNFDMFVMGGCLGMGAGFTLGYVTRALRGLVQKKPTPRPVRDRRLGSISVESKVEHDEHDRVVRSVPIALTVSRPKLDANLPEASTGGDRGDVVAALQGLGFKKADAVRAVDACSLAERASGVESWTRAALHKTNSR